MVKYLDRTENDKLPDLAFNQKPKEETDIGKELM